MSSYDPHQELYSISEPAIAIQDVLKWVYLWMGLGLLVTFGVATLVAGSPQTQMALFSGPWLWVALIGQLILVVVLSAALTKLTPGVAALMFLIYSALMGVTLSSIFLAYAQESIALAFLSSAALFGAMTVVGFTTQMDLTRMGTYLFMALIGLLIAMVVNFFMRSSGLEMVISGAGVLIFTGLTAYDTLRIKQMAADPELRSDGNMTMKLSVLGALKLYLDFINMFLFLLRLFGRQR